MGLDVYLYSAAEREAQDRHERQWNEWYDKYHQENGELPEGVTKEQSEAARNLIEPWVGYSEVPSQQFPSHLFNRRYLRSSYNRTGFNLVVPEILGQPSDLYWIFAPLADEDALQKDVVLTPDSLRALDEVRLRAKQVADKLHEADPIVTSSAGPVLGAASHLWSLLPTPSQVLEWYREKAKNQVGYAYSDAKGTIFGPNTVEILAITAGRSDFFPSGLKAIWVLRLSEEAKRSYVESALITMEFIDEAVELVKRDGSAVLSWSG